MPKSKAKTKYQESEDYVPNPTDQFGTLDTSGTAGSAHSQIEEVSPVFEVADRENTLRAAQALDPDDPTVDESLVTLPAGDAVVRKEADPDQARKRVQEKAKKAEKKDVEISSGRLTPAQEQAAEEGDTSDSSAEAAEKDTKSTDKSK